PVVRVRLHGLTLDTVADIADTPALTEVRELDLQRERLTAPVLAGLLRSTHLTRLRALNLSRNELGDDGVRAVVASDVFGRLRYLNLGHVGLSSFGVRALLDAVAARPHLALHWLKLRGAPGLRGDSPALPSTLPLRLRQSILGSLGHAPPRVSLLQQLVPQRTTLPADLRRWVEWLHAHRGHDLARAVTALPLPDAVRRAFAAACRRRAAWRAQRSGTAAVALPADAEASDEGLARAVAALTRLAEPGEESAALAECLLDLYVRHLRGEMPADGRTRGEPAT
ncbi:MAG: hypothetical protein ACRC33_21270, partial [Gemmataceae bacterium]